jgi:hypothetical protein
MLRNWTRGEPTLEELLTDEIMAHLLASDGLTFEELRLHLAEMARRLARPACRFDLCAASL